MQQRTRVRARGYSLVEILVVLAIIGMLSSIVGLVAFEHLQKARIQTSYESARTLRSAISMFQMQSATSDCPTVEALVANRLVDSASKTLDAWDNPFTITCADSGEIVVTSSGPDKVTDTPDDIRVPLAPRSSH